MHGVTPSPFGRLRRPSWPPAGRAMPCCAGEICSPASVAGPAAGALVGPAVGEAGQHPRDLLEGAQRGARGWGSARLAGAQPVDELGGRLRGLVVEELPVDHHDRRVVAGRVALEVLEGDLAVLGGLVVADAEVVLEGREDLVAAHDRAQRVGADADGVLAVGPALVLV